MSASMCSFSGGTIAAFCERGCCGAGCCSTTSTTGGGVTYTLIGIISALIFIFLVLVIIYVVLKRKGICQSRPDEEKPKPIIIKTVKKKPPTKGNKKLRKGQIIALGAFDWHGKKKNVQRDSKDTQTENCKCLPGDFIKWSNGFWLPVKRDKNAPKDERQNIRDVGVNTDAIKNNTRTVNIEPKVNNIDVVPKVTTTSSTTPYILPYKEAKPPSLAQPRALPVPTVKPPNASYRDVKLPYDWSAPNQRSESETRGSAEPILPRSDKHEDSSAKSVSFGPSPQPTVSTPRVAERQDTIELLNEFSRQMMNKK